MNDTHTTEHFFDGKLVFHQSRVGYRFSIDALILGAGVPNSGAEKILDAGCGCGVVGLLAAYHNPSAAVLSVDIQPQLVKATNLSINSSNLQSRVTARQADLRDLFRDSDLDPFDLILFNPPYFPPNSGRINPNSERAIARHQLHGDLDALLIACRRLLAPRGTLRLIYPSKDTPALFTALQNAGLKASRLRAIHSFPDAPARLILVDASPSGRRELTIAPPLFIYSQPGLYHELIETLLNGLPVTL